MPLDQTEAIVLRTSPIGEQDKLVTLLTRERGILRGVAKGARKFGNRFGSGLEPMSRITAFFYEKERRDLVTISGADLLESFFDLQAKVGTALRLAYFAELVEAFIPVRAHDDLGFRLLLAVLRALAAGADPDLQTCYFEAWSLQIGGVLPDVARCRRCRTAVAEAGWLSPRRDGVYCDACAPARKERATAALARFLAWAKAHPPSVAPEAPFAGGDLEIIRKALRAMIIHHLEQEPRSLRYVRD